jgi:leucyl-tRNA synthetase
MKKIAKEVAKFSSELIEEINIMQPESKEKALSIGRLDEAGLLREATTFLRREFDAEIYVFDEKDQERYDPKKRGRFAKPYRPAIYLE